MMDGSGTNVPPNNGRGGGGGGRQLGPLPFQVVAATDPAPRAHRFDAACLGFVGRGRGCRGGRWFEGAASSRRPAATSRSMIGGGRHAGCSYVLCPQCEPHRLRPASPDSPQPLPTTHARDPQTSLRSLVAERRTAGPPVENWTTPAASPLSSPSSNFSKPFFLHRGERRRRVPTHLGAAFGTTPFHASA